MTFDANKPVQTRDGRKEIILDDSLVRRFWEKVDRGVLSDCWAWLGGNQKGYGIVWGSNHGKPYLAHRVSWFIQNKKDPLEMCVLHHCDNPPCVNPDHLYLETRADNVVDMMRRGRHNTKYGEDVPGAKLTNTEMREVWQLAHAGQLMQKDIATDYGITESHVRAIKTGRVCQTITACIEFTEGQGLEDKS